MREGKEERQMEGRGGKQDERREYFIVGSNYGIRIRERKMIQRPENHTFCLLK
jgi:hypothetical protein